MQIQTSTTQKPKRKSERTIQKEILKRLSAEFHPRGIFWTADTGMARSMTGERKIRFGLPGQSDIQGVLDGLWIGIEVKRPGEKQQENQVIFQRAVEAAGGFYCVATSDEEAFETISCFISARVMSTIASRSSTAPAA